MLVALLSVVLVAQDQDPPRVTVEQRALRSDLAFAKMGDLFGVRLEVEGELVDDVVLVYLPSVTFDQFLARTAEGLSAEWTETDGVYTLRRTSENVASILQSFKHERLAQFKLKLASQRGAPQIDAFDLELLSDALIAPSSSILWTLENRGFSLSLVKRTASRVIAALTPEFISGLELNKKYVWAVGDRRIPSLPALDSAIDLYRDEAASYRRIFEESSADETVRSSVSRELEDPLRRIFGVGAPLKTAYLVLRPEVEGLGYRLLVFDDLGVELFVRRGFISCFPRFGEMAVTGIGLKPIERSAAALALQRTVFSGEGKIDDILREFIAGMPGTELLGEDASQILISVGKQTGKPVVAIFTDELLEDSFGAWTQGNDFRTVHPTIDPVSGLQWLSRHHKMVEIEGALYFSPRKPRGFRPVLDRDAAGRYAKVAGKTELTNLNMFFDVLLNSESDWHVSPATIALYGHGDQRHSVSAWEANYKLLFLLAGLSGEQLLRAQSPTGVRLTSSQMGKEFVRLLREELTAADVWENFMYAFGTDLDRDDDEPIFDLVSIDQILIGLDAGQLVRGAVVDLKLVHARQPVAVFWSFLGSYSVAPDQAASEYVDELKRSEERGARALSQLRFRTESSISISALLYIGGKRISMDERLVLGYDPSPSYRLDQMSPEYQKAFWDEVKRASATDLRPKGGRASPRAAIGSCFLCNIDTAPDKELVTMNQEHRT